MSKKKNIEVNIGDVTEKVEEVKEEVKTESVEEAGTLVVVGTDNLTIWQNEDASISLGYLKRGDKVTQLSKGENTTKIRGLNRALNETAEGYVFSKFLK